MIFLELAKTVFARAKGDFNHLAFHSDDICEKTNKQKQQQQQQ